MVKRVVQSTFKYMSILEPQVQSMIDSAVLSAIPYKSYQARVSQSGTFDPSVVEYKNDFGATTFTWSRLFAGQYKVLTNAGVLTTNKTYVLISPPATGTPGLVQYYAAPVGSDSVFLNSYLQSVIATVLTATATDSLMLGVLFEIRVYP